MQKTQKCPCCGATMNPYRVKVTPMMVRALVKFRQAVMDKNDNSIHLLKDMKGKDYELTRHEWNNFTRQRFLGLAVKDQTHPGYWILTRRGAAFLNGEKAIPAYVFIFRNKITERAEEQVYVSEVIGETPYMEKKEDIFYGEPAFIPDISFTKDGQGILV